MEKPNFFPQQTIAWETEVGIGVILDDVQDPCSTLGRLQQERKVCWLSVRGSTISTELTKQIINDPGIEAIHLVGDPPPWDQFDELVLESSVRHITSDNAISVEQMRIRLRRLPAPLPTIELSRC